MSDIQVRYKAKPESCLSVRMIQNFHRGDIPSLAMSNSSGAKETMKNTIYTIFDRDKDIDAITMVRASGSPFLIIRKGNAYYEVNAGKGGDDIPIIGKELEVITKAKPRGSAHA